jgi:carboxyl-terminal processing protease
MCYTEGLEIKQMRASTGIPHSRFFPALAAAICIVVLSTPLASTAGEFVVNRGDLEEMRKETQHAIQNLQYYHYKKQSIARLDQKEMLTSFMKDLDYHRLFFLQRDKEEILGRFGNTLISSYFSKGKWLYPAFQVFQIYRGKALSRLDWVFEWLQGDFDFVSDHTYAPDRSEFDWPTDAVNADLLWNDRLTFDLMQELLNGETLDRAREKVTRRYRRTQRQVEEFEPKNVQEVFLNTVAQMYDPHSSFYSSDTHEEFTISMNNSLEGIGALLREEDGYCIVQELIPGGPAEMGNQLFPGDKIVEVRQEGEDPVDVIDLKLRKIVKQIRGEKGSKVYLTVIPADSSDPSKRSVVTIIRDKIKLTENLAKAEIHTVPVGDSHTVPIGVIELPSFYGSGISRTGEAGTTSDVEELIAKLNKIGIKGLVLDLRRNGGGLLGEAINLTGLFIPKGPVVQVKDTTGQVREDWDTDINVAYDGPLVVLVSRHSASASEIVAGALQNHRRAIIVGDSSTHGKGTVQEIYDINRAFNLSFFKKPEGENFGATKVTIQKYYLPNGNSTQNKGVQADIALPSINDSLPIGESDLPNAMVWDTIDPLHWNPRDAIPANGTPIEPELVNFLRELSVERQATLEEFSFLNRNISWFKKKQDEKEFLLDLDFQQARKEADNQFREQRDADRDRLSKNGYAAKELLLDVTQQQEALHQEKLRHSLLPNGKNKANAYYQKVFYHQTEPEAPISEVWVERIDYEKSIHHAAEIVATLSEASGIAFDEGSTSDLLKYLKNAETSDEFNVEQAFADHFGDLLSGEAIDTLIPVFFSKLVEIDPGVVDNKPTLDIFLRESLRILVDWFQFNDDSFQEGTIATHPLLAPASAN